MVGERRNAKRLPPPLADGLDQGVEPGTNSRTSCAQRQATAILPAHSSASSREGTSTTENPPMYALLSGYGPSVTVPSVATTLTSSWECSPPPNTQTPASFASCTTACAASATSGRSSSGNVIAPSSNEIRYRVISRLLSRRPAPAASHPARDTRAMETDKPPRTHRSGQIQPHFFGRHRRTLAQAIRYALPSNSTRVCTPSAPP